MKQSAPFAGTSLIGWFFQKTGLFQTA